MPTPTANSLAGKGSDLQISINTTYTSIGGVKSIKGPGAKVGTRDVTTLASTAKEYAATIMDGGPVTASLLYDPIAASHTTIQTLLTTQPSTGNLFKLFTSTTTRFFAFNAIITGWDISGMDVDGSVMADLGLQINGPITFPVTT